MNLIAINSHLTKDEIEGAPYGASKEVARQVEVPGWFTPAQEAEHRRAYEDMLVDRFNKGLGLSASDKRDARRIIKARAGKR